MNKILLITTCLLVVFISCTKDSILNKEIKTLSESEFNSMVSNFSSAYASFETETELRQFISFVRLTDMNYEVDYNTLQNKYDRIHEEIENIKDEDHFYTILELNSNLLKLEISTNDELTLNDRHTFKTMKNLLNEDCILKIGETFRLYTEDIYIENLSYDYLKGIKNKEDAQSKGINFKTAYKIIYKNDEFLVDRSDEGVNFPGPPIDTILNDNPGCFNDRRLKINFVLSTEEDEVETTFGNIYPGFRVHGDAFVRADKKILGCIWVKYKTRIKWIDFFTTIETLNTNSQNNTSINTEYWEEHGLDTIARIINHDHEFFEISYFGDFEIDWKEITSTTTHQGMAGVWMRLNETY